MRHQIWLVAAFAALASGCVGLQEAMQERLSESRSKCLALAAWNDCGEQLAQGCGGGEDFKLGFLAGFEEICNGGLGRAPAVPPVKYWRGNVTGGNGNSAGQWFAGYREGVGQAKRCGHDKANMIPLSCTPEPDPQDQPQARSTARRPRRGDPPKRASMPSLSGGSAVAKKSANDRAAPKAPPSLDTEPPTESAPPPPKTVGTPTGNNETPAATPMTTPPSLRPMPPRPPAAADPEGASKSPVEAEPTPKAPRGDNNLPPFPAPKKSTLPPFPGKVNPVKGLPPFPPPTTAAPGPAPDTAEAPAAATNEVQPVAAANPDEDWSTPNSPAR